MDNSMSSARLDTLETKLNDTWKEITVYLNSVHREAARCSWRGTGTGDGRYCYIEANPTERADGFARLASRRTTGSNLYQQYDRLIRKMDPATDPEEESVIEAEMDELANKIDEVDEQLTETDATFTGLIAAPSYPSLPKRLHNE
ncbi:uncharacterized protein ARMOST_01312 [Armillaria ostoyae]|uniref:Uncharacterized protein n=1 Tax=Armillaria ostoyae TaxID=47428 RepID=A0A284QNL2_ARMOS|nr:uncharacterized protein ARMOST_01312 [Armillaria ostoyae]